MKGANKMLFPILSIAIPVLIGSTINFIQSVQSERIIKEEHKRRVHLLAEKHLLSSACKGL
jgi:hypothetical protein